MRIAVVLGAALACSAFAGCHSHHDVVSLAGEAKGEVIAIGTLATLGSFEWDASPLKTHAAVGLKHLPQLLHDDLAANASLVAQGKLTPEQGKLARKDLIALYQGKLDKIDAAHDLIEKALSTCKQDDHTGKCTGDEKQARTLLDQARNQLAVADAGLYQ